MNISLKQYFTIFYICANCVTLCSCNWLIFPSGGSSEIEKLEPIWKSSIASDRLVYAIFPTVSVQNGIICVAQASDERSLLRMFDKTSGKMVWEWNGMPTNDHFLVTRVYVYNNILIIHDTKNTYSIDIISGKTRWINRNNYSTVHWVTGFGQLYFCMADMNRIIVGNAETGVESSILIEGNPALFLPPSVYVNTENRDTMLVMGASGAEKDSTFAYYYKAYLAQYNLSKRQTVYQLLQQEGYASGTTGTLSPSNLSEIFNNQVYTAIGKSIQCNDIASGRIIWRKKFSSNFYISRIIQADGKIICNGDDNGIMYALDNNTGNTIWETKTTTASGDMFVMNGVAYMVGLGDGRLHAVDIQSGKRIWWLTCPDNQTNSDSSFEDAVTGDGQYIYVRSRLNLYCFKAAK